MRLRPGRVLRHLPVPEAQPVTGCVIHFGDAVGHVLGPLEKVALAARWIQLHDPEAVRRAKYRIPVGPELRIGVAALNIRDIVDIPGACSERRHHRAHRGIHAIDAKFKGLLRRRKVRISERGLTADICIVPRNGKSRGGGHGCIGHVVAVGCGGRVRPGVADLQVPRHVEGQLCRVVRRHDLGDYVRHGWCGVNGRAFSGRQFRTAAGDLQLRLVNVELRVGPAVTSRTIANIHAI